MHSNNACGKQESEQEFISIYQRERKVIVIQRELTMRKLIEFQAINFSGYNSREAIVVYKIGQV